MTRNENEAGTKGDLFQRPRRVYSVVEGHYEYYNPGDREQVSSGRIPRGYLSRASI